MVESTALNLPPKLHNAMAATESLDWPRDGADWPNRDASRFVDAGGVHWHVQIAGSGPPLLLLHGSGASTHSWRELLPLLACEHTVIAPDLPGHAFSSTPPAHTLSLPGMARAIGALLHALQIAPSAVAGHSAGAAIALRMRLDGLLPGRHLVSLNGALLPLPGLAGLLFPPAARLLSLTPFAAALFARSASRNGAVERLIASTGSHIDARGIALYARLVRCRAHVAGVLGMMANWDIAPLARDLPRLDAALTLIAARGDRTVPPDCSRRVQRMVADARLIELDGLGHLAHEEAPQRLAALIAEAVQ
jgi:magnesium chelatase accessory protein